MRDIFVYILNLRIGLFYLQHLNHSESPAKTPSKKSQNMLKHDLQLIMEIT